MGIFEFLHLYFILNSRTNFTSSIDFFSNQLISVYSKQDPVFTSEIETGCEVKSIEVREVVADEIVHIEEVKWQDFYAPLTPSE